MAVGNDKMAPTSSAIKSDFTTTVAPVINRAAVVIRVRQIPFSFLVEGVQLYAAAVTTVVTMLVGLVRVGRAIQAVTLVIGTTVSKFKLNAALTAVMPHRVGSALPVVVNKGVQDNVAFSSAFTINLAAAAGQFWGAVRVQMAADGTISTKVSSPDQAFLYESAALYACPAADDGAFDLGTITIECATGAAFTAQTTALNAAGTTVHYNGTAAGFVNVCTADPSFAQASLVRGVLVTAENDRAASQAGGLLVVKETTDGTGAATDAVLDIGLRAWPVNGETAPAVQE